MNYYVIYDGNCNLCVNSVRSLESLDQGKLFSYVPMQDDQRLLQWGITAQDCEQGMILIDANEPQRRWQGSNAIEEIGHLLPAGRIFIEGYRALPGMKWVGDVLRQAASRLRFYEQIRDNRYAIFGKRSNTYQSSYCVDGSCKAGNE
jgi:predicted DCC family thiol-disulfide oxidoreductase YuxK